MRRAAGSRTSQGREGCAPVRPPQARCPRPQGRPNATRHFLGNASSSEHHSSEQPGNWTSDHRVAAATKRGPPRRVKHAPLCAGVPERGRPVRLALPFAECLGKKLFFKLLRLFPLHHGVEMPLRRITPDGSGLGWTAWTSWTWGNGDGWPKRPAHVHSRPCCPHKSRNPPQASTRTTRSTRLIIPGALAEGLDQSEFHPYLQRPWGRRTGRPRSGNGRGGSESSPHLGRVLAIIICKDFPSCRA